MLQTNLKGKQSIVLASNISMAFGDTSIIVFIYWAGQAAGAVHSHSFAVIANIWNDEQNESSGEAQDVIIEPT